jgi:hypothetical protein
MLHRLLVQARTAELLDAARTFREGAAVRESRRARRRRARDAIGLEAAVTIRYAFPDDAQALARLAALDSRQLPSHPVLVAEVDGQLRAAMSIQGGEFVADPFHRTVALLDLLAIRARQLAAAAERAPAPAIRAAPIARFARD